MPIPHEELQQLNQTSPLIELFILDLTRLGGSIYRFTNDGAPVVHAGHTYQSIPIKCEGWDFTSTGAPPQPTVTVSNVSRTLLADVIGLGDLVGATFTRVRIYAKHLDGAEFEDPTRIIGPEVYIIDRKTGHNKNFIQFQLSSVIDRFGIRLPRRQILKDKGFPGVSRTRITG